MKYYSVRRPILLGGYPKPQGNKVLEIHNFDEKTLCDEIGKKAWGYIVYEDELSEEDAINYELTASINNVKLLHFAGIDNWGREVFMDSEGKFWKYTEPGEMPRERHERLYSSEPNDINGEPGFPMKAELDYEIFDL